MTQQQHRQLGNAPQQAAQQLARGGVDPVQVFHYQHLRPLLGVGQQPGNQGIVCAALALRWLEVTHRQVLGVDQAQQAADKRRGDTVADTRAAEKPLQRRQTMVGDARGLELAGLGQGVDHGLQGAVLRER